jgi:uncharacterized protein YyaL (SSP411 family)
MKLDPSRVRDLIESARAKLKTARDQRKAPFVDRSVYVSWNAMMCDAFLEAGAILDRPDCTDFALKTLELLWSDGFVAGNGMVHRVPVSGLRSPVSGGPWLLDDQVQAIFAFLTAFEHTGDGRWLDRAREVADMTIAFYWDEKDGGFFDAREQSGGFLDTRSKPIQDAPTSSPNSTAALALLRLAVLADEPKYRDRAEKLLAAFAGRATELGIHGSTYLRALDWFIRGETKVVVFDTTGGASPAPADRANLSSIALTAYRPRKIVAPARTSPVPGTPAPVALVCAGSTCAAPVTTADALRQTLESFARQR